MPFKTEKELSVCFWNTLLLVGNIVFKLGWCLLLSIWRERYGSKETRTCEWKGLKSSLNNLMYWSIVEFLWYSLRNKLLVSIILMVCIIIATLWQDYLFLCRGQSEYQILIDSRMSINFWYWTRRHYRIVTVTHKC